MYKIFQENRALIFPNIEAEQLKFGSNSNKCESYDAQLLCDFLSEWLCDTEQTDTIIQDITPEDVSAALQQMFKMAPAAGGIVTDDGRCLMIERKGIPDLPKGHIEAGESPETAAMREVEEETGIGGLEIVNPLPSTWHVYLRDEVWELKQTYWYEMKSSCINNSKPQTEEGITAVNWIDKSNINNFLSKTFRSISEILGKELCHLVTK